MTRAYTANHKQWAHTGWVVPEVEKSESQRPASEFKVAAWLPLQRQDQKNEEYLAIASGKVIALDREGNVVPAGLKYVFEAGVGDTILTYDATDYANKVTDLTTGVAYATNGSTSYTQTQVTAALRERGLIRATETARDFISWPVGYAPYTMFQWGGGDGVNPANFIKHNHILQHKVAIACDYVIQVPQVPAQQATETMGDGSISSSAITFGTSQWHDSAGIYNTERYAADVSTGDNVVCYVFGKYPVAKITDETPITDSGSTLAGWTEVSSIAAVIAKGTGYYYIDYEAGVMFVWAGSGGIAVPTGFTDGTSTITYYHYETAATGSQDIVMGLGDLKPGDLVTFDSYSNYVKWTPDIGTCYGGGSGDVYAADPTYDSGADSTISAQLETFMEQSVGAVVGQVIALETFPRGGLEKVRTQFKALSRFEEMPGSATDGRPDSVVQAGGANKVVVINFFTR